MLGGAGVLSVSRHPPSRDSLSSVFPLFFMCTMFDPFYGAFKQKAAHTALTARLRSFVLCFIFIVPFFCVPAPCWSSFLLAMLYPPQHYTCEYFSYISILGCTGSSKHRKIRFLLYGLWFCFILWTCSSSDDHKVKLGYLSAWCKQLGSELATPNLKL